MKSKRLRNTTRSRNVKKTKRRSRHRRRQRTKRGGMHRAVFAAARSTLGTTYYHEFVPLLKRYRQHLLTKEIPTPSQGSVVPFGERHHTIFEGVEIDDGTKYMIKNMPEEDLNNPVKWGEKVKTLYDKVISGLEEEERKRKIESAHQQAHARGNPRPVTGQGLASLLTPSQRTSSSSSSSASSSPFANTPQSLRASLTTTQSPSHLNIKQSTEAPNLGKKQAKPINYDDGYQVKQQLFPLDGNSTPHHSPPGSPAVVAPKSNNKENSAPLSPMRPLPPY